MARGQTGYAGASIDEANAAERDGVPVFCFHKRVTGSTTAWTVVAELRYAVRVIGVTVICRDTNANGTVRVDSGSNAITSAITCDTDTEVTGLQNGDGAGAPATVDDTYYKIAKGGSLKLTTANSADGDVFVFCVRDEG